jgi:hypothetical protein
MMLMPERQGIHFLNIKAAPDRLDDVYVVVFAREGY